MSDDSGLWERVRESLTGRSFWLVSFYLSAVVFLVSALVTGSLVVLYPQAAAAEPLATTLLAGGLTAYSGIKIRDW